MTSNAVRSLVRLTIVLATVVTISVSPVAAVGHPLQKPTTEPTVAHRVSDVQEGEANGGPVHARKSVNGGESRIGAVRSFDSDTDGGGPGASLSSVEGVELANSATDVSAIVQTDGTVKSLAMPLIQDKHGDLLTDGVERAIGTSPTEKQMPTWLAGGVVGFIIGTGFESLRTGNGSTLLSKARTLVQRPTFESDQSESDTAPSSTVDGDDQDSSAAPPEEDTGSVRADSAQAAFEHRTELLADERVITQMLRAEGGRMKQNEIVAVTDWSKAKVSRVLSTLEAEDEIIKLSLGRENLICLEGAQPQAAA